MILNNLVREDHEAFRRLEDENLTRQYSYLQSIIVAATGAGHDRLSGGVIRALNYHAISCLHPYAGEYRPCRVTVGEYEPPEHYRVPGLMDDFINDVNRHWDADAVSLATHCLWRLNHIHPFVNGNGRTARATSYYVLCARSGGALPGSPILPELLRQNHDAYVEGLRAADGGNHEPLTVLVSTLLRQQVPELQA